MAIGLLRNSGMDPLEKQLGITASRGRSVRPSVIYVDDLKKKNNVRTPLTEFSGSAHVIWKVSF